MEIYRFTKELLRDRRRTVGRLDSRFTASTVTSPARDEYDPSLTNFTGPYTAHRNDYSRRAEVREDLPYEILNLKVWPWSYASMRISRHYRE